MKAAGLLYEATHLLVHVPVQAGVLQDEPVLLPLLREVTLSVLLLPQPALAVAPAQIFTRNSPLTDGRQGTACTYRIRRGISLSMTGIGSKCGTGQKWERAQVKIRFLDPNMSPSVMFWGCFN